jgi:lipoate-protein ligase A
MKYLDLTLPTPAENLALDEALLELAEREGDETLRVWESPWPFVVLGLSNHLSREANVDACRELKVEILRRCSGGGTVVQGPGCLSYALALRIDEAGPLATIGLELQQSKYIDIVIIIIASFIFFFEKLNKSNRLLECYCHP